MSFQIGDGAMGMFNENWHPTLLAEPDEGEFGGQTRFLTMDNIFKDNNELMRKLRNLFLEAKEKGNWLKSLQMCLNIARATRRMHAAGLAHSDLSYKNVLVDPQTGRGCIIDIDGLVVPGKYPPDVVGTPDFIAPWDQGRFL